MNKRAFTLSLVIALLSMLMVDSYMGGKVTELTKKYGNVKSVVVANKNINAFEVLDSTKLVEKTIPAAFIAPGSFSKREDLQNQIALVPILKGEQITSPRISHPDGSTGLARQVSPNKRAISIRIADDQAVSKLIKPGDRVDILARIDFGGGRKDLQKIKTILQDVLVLATGLSITNALPLAEVRERRKSGKIINLNSYTNYNTVTVEVVPADAQKLIFQIDVMGAKPYLTLRNNNDRKREDVRSTRLFDVLDDDAAEARSFFNKKNPRGGR